MDLIASRGDYLIGDPNFESLLDATQHVQVRPDSSQGTVVLSGKRLSTSSTGNHLTVNTECERGLISNTGGAGREH